MKLQFFSDYTIIIRSMKKVKHILAIFLHSFIPHDGYYPKLLHTRLSFSLKYYLIAISFFACIFTGIVLYQLSPVKITSYKNSVINSLSTFPEEVKIRIKNGVLESNQNKPLFLWVYRGNQPLFVFMVHTKDIPTSSYNPLPLIFLGSDKVLISYRGNTVVNSYGNSLNVLITKESVQSLITNVNSFFPFFMFFLYLFLVIVMPLVFIISMTFFILLSSFLVYILLRTFFPHIHLKKCIQAGLHGTHIPFFIILFLFLLFPFAENILIVAASLIFVFTLVSTYEMYSVKK